MPKPCIDFTHQRGTEVGAPPEFNFDELMAIADARMALEANRIKRNEADKRRESVKGREGIA